MRSLAANDVGPHEKRTRLATDRLLSSLKEHHDFTIPAPPPKPAPKPVLVTDQWVERQKTKPQWFAVVEDLGPVEPRSPTVQEIIAACGRYFNMKRSEMLANRRLAKIVYARQIAMYLAHSLTGRSYPEIGRKLGYSDHTTILYGAKKIKQLLRTNWTVAYDIAQVEAML